MADNPIEDLLVRAYPNPQRTGCPGTEKLKEMAQQPVPLNDSMSVHVWHCSPCFEEFKELRDGRRSRERKTLTNRVTVGAAALLVALGLTSYLSRGHHPAIANSGEASQKDQLEVGILDFGGATEERGIGESANGEQRVPASSKELNLALPLGSEAGEYDVEIRSGADLAKTIRALHGRAVKEPDGRTRVRCVLGSPQISPGSYVAAWRAHGSELWHYGTFSVS